MDLKTQIDIWNSVEDYASIIETISNLPEDDLTPELVEELGYAHVQAAEGEDRELLEIGLILLSAVEEPLGETAQWNYRMGVALYHLERQGSALAHFRRVLELDPEDLSSKRYISQCEEAIALPRFEEPFSERVRLAWQDFEDGEAELRSRIEADMAGLAPVSQGDDAEQGVAEKCDELLSTAFSNSSFELGFDGKKYELTLTAEDGPAEVFKLRYFKDRAPASVREHWNIEVGRQPEPDYTIGIDDAELTADDIRAWVEWDDESAQVNLYAEELADLIDNGAGEQSWWIASALLDHTLGEICAMSVIGGLDILSEPLDTQGMPLSSLPTVLSKAGFDMDNTPERLTEATLIYEAEEPETDEDADWRLDIVKGYTSAPAIIDGYFADDPSVMDSFHNDGAVPGFIAWPIEALEGKDKQKALNDFCDALESGILKRAGSSAVTFIGGATGLYAAYLDFIAWNLQAVLDAAVEALADLGIAEATFHTLRREGDSYALIGDEE